MITVDNLLLWTPFVILAFATILFVILSWRGWLGRNKRHNPGE